MTRNLSIDVLRVVLALLVVAAHANMAHESYPLTAYVMNAYVARATVPLFFIISGYYFFQVVQRERVRPWVVHVLKLYLVWTAVYLPLVAIAHPDYTLAQAVESILIRLLVADWFLWFLHAMPFVGLLTWWLRDRRTVPMLWTLAALYLVGLVLQYLVAYGAWNGTPFAVWAEQPPLYRNFLFVGLPFFYLGYLCARHRVGEGFGPRIKALLLAGGIAGMVLEFAINDANGLTLVRGLEVLTFEPLLVFAVFMIAIHTKTQTRGRALADLALVIYVTHPMFLFLLRKYGPLEDSIAIALTTMLLSMAMTPLVVRLNRRVGWLL